MIVEIIIFAVVGIVGGVIGGMGMGGGTLLIPLLTIFSGVEQHMAQAINLIAFIPTAIVALIVHIRNKLVEKKHILIVAIPLSVYPCLHLYCRVWWTENLYPYILGFFWEF